jgi:hypothetical protein
MAAEERDGISYPFRRAREPTSELAASDDSD